MLFIIYYNKSFNSEIVFKHLRITLIYVDYDLCVYDYSKCYRYRSLPHFVMYIARDASVSFIFRLNTRSPAMRVLVNYHVFCSRSIVLNLKYLHLFMYSLYKRIYKCKDKINVK